MKKLTDSELLTIIFLLTTFLFISIGCKKEPFISFNEKEINLPSKIILSNVGKVRIPAVKVDQMRSLNKNDPKWMGRTYAVEEFIEKRKGATLVVGHPKKTGQSKIFFKPFDLPEDVTIRFEWRISQSLEGLLIDTKFGPHGIIFNRPVRVELSYQCSILDDINEDQLRVFYFNEDDNIWEYIGGTVDKYQKTISVYLHHFSRYAIGEMP